MKLSATELVASLQAEKQARDDIQGRSEALAGEHEHEPRQEPLLIAFVPITRMRYSSPCPFLVDLLEGIESRARVEGCDVVVFTSELDSYVERCKQHGISGAIFHGLAPADPHAKDLAKAGIPSVEVEGGGTDHRIAQVRSDNIQAAALAVRHLYAHGCRRIATIAGHHEVGVERLLGYRTALRELALPYREEYVFEGDFFLESGLEGMKQLLALPEPPDAVFAAGDVMAIGAMSVIEQAGLRVPDDVAVIGFDDLELATLVTPQLTTMRQDMQGLGVASTEALLEMLEHPGQEAPDVLLDVELIERESCGAHASLVSENGAEKAEVAEPAPKKPAAKKRPARSAKS